MGLMPRPVFPTSCRCPLLQGQVGIFSWIPFLCAVGLAQGVSEIRLHLPLHGGAEGLSATYSSPCDSPLAPCLPACNVLFVNSVDMESLTGPQAISKATSETLAADPTPAATIVHFKVSAQGITLTDNQRK